MNNLFTAVIFIVSINLAFGKDYVLTSPDKNTEVALSTDAGIVLKVQYRSKELFSVENISLNLGDNFFTPEKVTVKKARTGTVNRKIIPQIREKYSVITETYNELQIMLRGDYVFVIRAYDDGVAYRFVTIFNDSITIENENFELTLQEEDSLYFQRSKTFNSSYETPYEHLAIGAVTPDGYCCLPALVRKPDGMNILIAESGLEDYPGLWLQGTGRASLTAAHAGFPLDFKHEGSPYGQGQVKKHADYIARTAGSRNFPWRIFVIAEDDGRLLSNTLVYQLANPSRITDVSWIKPGVVTFDWWGRRNIYGVDFKSGVNTATAKYFIDFAAELGFEYFLFDDGWSRQEDLFAINPDLDMDAVMAYAKEKGVKIMLWVIWNTFERQKEQAWEQFGKWGISGIKFDFMNRDDQQMVRFYYEMAEEAAKRKMVIDFHGAYKPSGLRRVYPNVLTREALIEFEYNGSTKYDTPVHHNLLPYIRLVTGPADYIPYTTNNAQKKNFRPVGDRPMGMGTRAHSMALFIIMGSPMQMLPDSPSDYYRELECTEFISKIPVEWDDLRVLKAKVGEYTVLARKNGDDWYVGAITNWSARSFDLPLDFLENGTYQMEFVEDGINADQRAIDYIKKSQTVTRGDTVRIRLAPGGGWVARLIKTRN